MLTGVLAACSDGGAPATQLAARVDGKDVSVHLVNQALSRTGTNLAGLDAESLAVQRREALERTIEQQLAVNQALASGLDRKPEVMTQIEAARREILARSYRAQLISGLVAPEDAEARKYYVEHPQLFSQRRIFRVHELMVPDKDVSADNLRVATAGKPLQEVQSWLRSQNIRYAANSGLRAAEQMPLDVLAQLEHFKDGQSGIIETAHGGTLIVQLISSQPAPVDEATAMPVIRKYLQNRQILQAIAADNQRLRNQAKVEYFNEFVALNAGAGKDGAHAPAQPGAAPSSPFDAATSGASAPGAPSPDDGGLLPK